MICKCGGKCNICNVDWPWGDEYWVCSICAAMYEMTEEDYEDKENLKNEDFC